MQAKFYFYHGPMGSGKSMQLLAKAYNFEERKIEHVLLKPSTDTRNEGVIYSRALGEKPCLLIKPDEAIIDLLNRNCNVKDLKWILVDEAQFLTTEQVNQLSRIVDCFDISVICYGIRTDSMTHLFEGSKRLFEIADTIEEIKSSCSCGRKNIVNARIDKDGDIEIGGNQIEVGGDEKYTAMCRKCFFDKVFGY